ncbi:MAG: ferritin [Firmicutes bacterium]|nr:ferritin [Bacillota bacterium]
MISEALANALSDQVNAEYYSAYLYQAMSTYAESTGFKGAANWLWVQAREEMAHAVHMYQYLLDRGALPTYAAIDAPPAPASFSSLMDVFQAVLVHELKVTARINDIATLAMQENDHACYQFIMWYVNEQVEEESNDKAIIDRLKFVGENMGQLLTLDNELAARVYVNPFPTDVKLM